MERNWETLRQSGCDNLEDACKYFGATRFITQDEFNRISFRSKEDVLEQLMSIIKYGESNEKIKLFFGENLYSNDILTDRFGRILLDFYNELVFTPFFENLEPWWSYQLFVSEKDINLYLCNIDNIMLFDDGSAKAIYNFKCEYIYRELKSLTISEFAELYNVSDITVRQWIRRGKIRSAYKVGNEWRIPEMSWKSGRKYSKVYYHTHQSYEVDEYPFLRDIQGVTISQDRNNRKLYNIYFGLSLDEDKNPDLQMDVKEREKFELYLICHPSFRCGACEIVSFGFYDEDYGYLLKR